MSLVSVIIPMFNSEKFIQTCIDSILTQTFKDFEVIVIDECSTDRSFKIVEAYEDPRIKLYRKTVNLHDSKNFALTLTNDSKYIYFMNSIDAILPQTLEILVNAVEQPQADVVFMNSFFIAQNSNFKLNDKLKVLKTLAKNPKPRFLVEDIIERLQSEFIEQGILSEPSMKLIRRDFMLENSICYPDEILNLAILLHAKNARVIDFCGYIRRNKDETSHQKQIQDVMHSLPKIIEELEKLLRNLSLENRLILKSHVIFSILIVKLIQSNLNLRDKDQVIQKFFEDHHDMNPEIFRAIFEAFMIFITYCSTPNQNQRSIFQLKGVLS